MHGCRWLQEDDICHFGCAAGVWDVQRNAPAYRRLTLKKIVEKPTRDYARGHLLTPGLREVSERRAQRSSVCESEGARLPRQRSGDARTHELRSSWDRCDRA